MSPLRLAAVVFDAADPVDALIAASLSDQGHLRIAGWLQARLQDDSCACRDIVLTALQGGGQRMITQNLGAGSSGCRLDGAALAEVAGWLLQDLETAPDLLVLNRFGKSEAGGGGLRQVLEQALAQDLAVLVPVNRKQLGFWRDFSQGLGQELPCTSEAITGWIADLAPRREARPAAE